MVLKMLYNWDDMHIFGFAFPKKNPAQLQPDIIFRWSIIREQKMPTPGSGVFRAFIHHLLDSHSPTMPWGTRQSGACVSKRPGRVWSVTVRLRLEHSFHKHPAQTGYSIYLYINKYRAENRRGGGGRGEQKGGRWEGNSTKTRWLTCS